MRALAAMLTALLLSAPQVAAADQSLSAVVWLRGETDSELLERVRGQVIDLPVTLVEVADRRPSPGQGRRRARQLGAQHGATIVIWFRAQDDVTSVYIADLAGDRLLVRHVEHRGDDQLLARSAALEAAAMVVRSALRALAAGGAIGVREEPEPPAAVVRAPAAALPPPVIPARRSFVFAGAGWSGAFTDGDSTGHHGLVGAVGWARDRVRLALAGAHAIGVDYADAMSTIRLTRSAITARFEHRVAGGRAVEMGAGVGAGVALFSRTTVAAGELSPTEPSRFAAPLVTPSLHLRVRPSAGALAVELEAGADVLLRRPQFGYEIGGQFVDRNRLWPVGGRLGISLVVEGR